MTEPKSVRVKIRKPAHIYMSGVVTGLREAQLILEKLPPSLRQTPGMALAISTIAAKAHEERASIISKHLAAIARAGHDVALHKNISFDANTAELVCEFYDPDLLDDVEDIDKDPSS